MDLLIGSQRFQQDSSVAQRTNRRAHPLIRARYAIAWTGFAVRSFNAVTTYPSVAGNSVGIGIERIKDAVVRTSFKRYQADDQAIDLSTRYEIGNVFNPPTKLARSHSGFPLKSIL